MSTKPKRTVSATGARLLAAGLEAAGYATEGALAAAGIDVDLSDPTTRVPHGALVALWDHAARQTGDANFGLHAALFLNNTRLSLGRIDLVDYAVRASATLGDALERMARCNAILLDDFLALEFERGKLHARVIVRLSGEDTGLRRHRVECAVAAVLLRARSLSAATWRPEQVTFRHPRPENCGEHEALFDAPLKFDAAEDALVLDRAALSQPLLSADPRLCAVLDQQIEQTLARMVPAPTLTTRVRTQIGQIIGSKEVDARTIARGLGLSTRTLQRRLRDEGTSLSDVFDHLRREMAMERVGEGVLSVSEIAFALGFHGTPAFLKAFKRWTGKAPKAFRM